MKSTAVKQKQNVTIEFSGDMWEVTKEGEALCFHSTTTYEGMESYCKRKGYNITDVNWNDDDDDDDDISEQYSADMQEQFTNNISNPLILNWTGLQYKVNKPLDQSGEYIDKPLAVDLVKALELAKDIMTTYNLMKSKAGFAIEEALKKATK